MKHKKIYLPLSLLIGLLAISFCSSAIGWANGPLGYTSSLRPEAIYKKCAIWAQEVGTYEEAVSCYRRFYRSDDSAWYSTHDYIAHFALDYLCASDTSGRYNWLKDPNFHYFYVYLLATEYPDYEISMFPELTLDNGHFRIIRSEMPSSHSYTKLNTLNAARKAAGLAVQYLNSPYHYRETTAFYLGLIAHYIGDLAFPPHILRPYVRDFDSSLNHDVSKVTTLVDYHMNGNNRFFSIDLERILGYTPDKLNLLDLFKFLPNENYKDVVYFISEMMAFTTLLNLEVFFNLKVGNGTWSVQNLYNFYKENGKLRFDGIERHDVEYKQYLDRIEELLNWAVYWTAAALKICIDQWDKKNPKEEPPHPQPEPSERNPPLDTADFLVRYGAMIAAVTALGILGRKLFGQFTGRF
jgi:hypothetical protein